MGKGSSTRVRDVKRYDENFEKIDWSGGFVQQNVRFDVMDEVERQREINAEKARWVQYCNEKFVKFVTKDGDGDDGNADEVVGTH